jgi:transcriptional regulator with XRE-family HTH domain
MDIKHRVGLRIRAIRKRRGLTQEALGERAGRSADTISALERGKSLPSFETLERLAVELNVPIKDFFDFEDDDAASPKRAALVATITDVARSLTYDALEIAAAQIQTLARRTPPRA